MSKTYKTVGVVLKRFNYGEADRMVTIYTEEMGKVVCLAKGVRKLTSKKKGSLEPATEAKFFLVKRKSIDLLTQTELINSHKQARADLTRLTQLYQMLEIVDLLTVEEQENQQVYGLLKESLGWMDENGGKKKKLLEQIRLILVALGFSYDKDFSEQGLRRYIEELAEKKLRSKPFLTVSQDKLE